MVLFEVLERINDNAYKVDLPGAYGLSVTFNVADISPYFEDDHLANLRTNSPQQGEDAGGPSMAVSLAHPNNPQRSNYKSKVKERVKSFLVQQAKMPTWAYSKSLDFMTLFGKFQKW